MTGLLSYGAYIPSARLACADIGKALRTGGGTGHRAVANFDEDTTSMGVAAARDALADMRDRAIVRQLVFATSAPAYADKANATAIHAATGLRSEALAVDMVGSARSGIGALMLAARAAEPTLAVLADQRGGLPGSTAESEGGDAAAAFVFGSSADRLAIAEIIGEASATDEFLDRWRLPGDRSSRVWEERFAAEIYPGLAETALSAALERAGLKIDKIDHLVVTGLHARAVRRVIKRTGANSVAIDQGYQGRIGNCGTAEAGVQLADVLDRAGAGQTIALVVLSDGVSVLIFRTTRTLETHRAVHPVAAQVEDARPISYATFLSWSGRLQREPQRRPRPSPPYAPPAYRRRRWKFGLVGGRCSSCGRRQANPGRVCAFCRSVDSMQPEALADIPATIAFETVDRLAFSPHPPLTIALVDFEGGGRLRCQLTDLPEDWNGPGKRVEMTFRRMFTTDGIHNYFWKARPLRPVRERGA